MIIDVKTHIGRRISESATHYASASDRGVIVYDGREQTARVIDDWAMGDRWYIFGGHCMEFTIIRADSFESAYDIFLSECAGDSELEDDMTDEELEYGTWTSDGKWFSEVTTSYIFHIDMSRVDAARVEFIAD